MSSLKILIIDDEKSIRALLSSFLDPFAVEILELNNGQYVMGVIDSQAPDLVITDLVMPEKDGLEIIRETKDRYPTLPVYAISAYREYIEIASDLGADETFPKPIDKDRLINCVRNLSDTEVVDS